MHRASFRLVKFFVFFTILLVPFAGVFGKSEFGANNNDDTMRSASAQPSGPCANDGGELEVLQGLFKGSSGNVSNCAGQVSLVTVFALLAQVITGLIIGVGLIVVVAAGYIYMTAGGDGSKVEMAKTMIRAALLGIILALSAVMILRTISPQFTPTEDPELILPQ